MDRQEYEALMAHRRRQMEDLDIAKGEALFCAIQRAMQLHSENRDSHRDIGWREAMVGLADAFESATREVISQTGLVLQQDLD